jgi:nitroimidazol reductase NimA-like FMN-containing flavoprotein (pyridoxamine 5'-phosphate oxidase superfamily)
MPDESPSAVVDSSPAPRAIAPLTDAECREILAGQRLCIMSLVDGDEPYSVPVFYGFDGESLYLGVAEGRKTRVLDANPRVYLVVTDVGPGDRWRSVAIAGRARTLSAPEERQRGIEVLIAHNARVRQPDPNRPNAPPRRPRSGRILYVENAAMTGRAFG